MTSSLSLRLLPTLTLAIGALLLISACLDSFAQENAPAADPEKTEQPASKRAGGNHPAFVEVEDVPGLPRVLLIGDSISMGYTLPVRKTLEGKANVHRVKGNCGPTDAGVRHLDKWLEGGPWDVIHFNWGLHDVIHHIKGKGRVPHATEGAACRISPQEYEENLRTLLAAMKQTDAALIWASTTPIPEGLTGMWKPGDAERYNRIAAKVMEENDIAVNDLWTFAKPRLAEIQLEANVHFSGKGSGVLGSEVARVISAELKK